MPKARSVIDTILGEAGGKTRQERFNDMVAIASAMQNRAALTGQTLDSIISAPNQFDAFNRELPAGVEAYRDLAEAAVSYVETNGPIHEAAYYATPSAVGNLPSALAPAGATTAHQYFTDPQNRAIATATGYVTPNAQASKPRGMEALAPHGLLDTFNPANAATGEEAAGIRSNMADIGYSLGPNRPNRPNTAITDTIRSSVRDVLGPGYSVSVTSGTENPGQQYGSNRHKTGLAADFGIIDPLGRRLSTFEDSQAFADVAQGIAAKGGLGLGFGTDYMGGIAMHADKVQPGPGQDYSWGNLGNLNTGLLNDARNFSLMPASFYEKSLPSTMTAPAARPTTDMVAGARTVPSSTPMSFVGQARPTAPSAVDKLAEVASRPAAMTASPAGLTTKGAVATAPNAMTAPNFAAQSLGATVAPTSVKTASVPDSLTMGTIPGSIARMTPFDAQFQSLALPETVAPTVTGLPPSLTAPALTALTPPAQLAPVAVPAPRAVRQVPIARPQMTVARPAAPPSLSVADVYGGMTGSAIANDGSRVSNNGLGLTSVTNGFGVTTGMVGGKQTAVGPGPSFGGLGGLGGIAGPAIGSAIGSALAGPVGGIIGGVVGRNLTKDPTGQSKTGGLGGLGGFFGGFFGGNTGSKSSGGKSASSGKSSSGSAGRSAGSAGFGGNRAGSARSL